MTAQFVHSLDPPGSDQDITKMPGHWLLARTGKRVFRLGGLGLGTTAHRILVADSKRYSGIARDSRAAAWTRQRLPKAVEVSVATGTTDNTRLGASCASVALGESMPTTNTPAHKQRIVDEAFRILRPGGRYGTHELCVIPDAIFTTEHQAINRDLSSSLHVGARPLRPVDWCDLLERAGFGVIRVGHASMHLLRLRRLIEDEGFVGALRIARNVLIHPKARKRVLAIRKVVERHQANLNAKYIVAQKPKSSAGSAHASRAIRRAIKTEEANHFMNKISGSKSFEILPDMVLGLAFGSGGSMILEVPTGCVTLARERGSASRSLRRALSAALTIKTLKAGDDSDAPTNVPVAIGP